MGGKCKHPEGCGKFAQGGGFCMAHGGTVSKCKHPEGCEKQALKGGLCMAHRGTQKMSKCKHPEGCEKQAKAGGFCVAHGGTKTKKKRKRHDVDNDDSDQDQDGEEEEEEEEVEGRVDGFEDVQDEARAVAVAAIGHVAAKKRDVPRVGKAGKCSRSDGDIDTNGAHINNIDSGDGPGPGDAEAEQQQQQKQPPTMIYHDGSWFDFTSL